MALSCSKIWSASSLGEIRSACCFQGARCRKLSYLVGVRMTANIPTGSIAQFCSMGIANAMVFPDPVRLPPMQSRPSRIFGMHPFWMPVGRLIAMAARAPTSHGCTPIDSKLALVVGTEMRALSSSSGSWLSSGGGRVWIFPTREGTAMAREGASGEGDSFRLFLEPSELVEA